MALLGRRRQRQELHCHNCDRYVQFIVDHGLDGNHVLNCPNCGHEHCCVVKDGIITEDRWDQRNGTTYQIRPYLTASTVTSVYTATSSAYFTMATTWTTS